MSVTVESAASLSASLTHFDYAQLLDQLDYRLQGESVIEAGIDNGLFQTLRRRRGGSVDGVHPTRPGIDRVTDLDIRASIANDLPHSLTHHGSDSPSGLHLLAEWGERYHASTGEYTLPMLGRLSVALSLLAAERASSKISAVFTAEHGRVSQLGYEDQERLEPYEFMEAYDEFVNGEPIKLKKRQPKPEHALSQELVRLASEDSELQPDNDAVVVVSDWIDGARFDKDRQLEDFAWEAPLTELHDILGDRLYVVRLMTPAHNEEAYGYSFNDGEVDVEVDMAGYLNIDKTALDLGNRKAERIADCMRHMRVCEVSTVDDLPLSTVSDFMFGSAA